MTPRLTSEIWVAAYLTRCRLADIPAFVVARGDHTAGAVLVKLNTNDAANTNDCMAKSEQVASQSAREDGKHRLHLDLYCQGHQTCLLNRPLIESAGDYETFIVRLGNILSHNIRISGLLSSFDMILDNSGFVFKLVLDLPPEHHN